MLNHPKLAWIVIAFLAALVVAVVLLAEKYPDPITALATVVIGWFAAVTWRTNRQQLEHQRRVERAYLKISHSAPGIRQLDPSGHIFLRISIKNFGRTPARVTDFLMKPVVVPHGDPLPAIPDYTVNIPAPAPNAFLVTNDEIFV